MKNIYNNAGDLLVCAFKMMNEGKTRKALECAELALKLPSMRVIASGLESMNKIHASDEDLDEDIELEEDVKDEEAETCPECGKDPCECASDEEEDVDVEEDIDVEDEEADSEDDDDDIDVDLDLEDESEDDIEESDTEDEDSEPEDESIDEDELDEVLSSLRAQYKVTSSIVTAARRKVKKTKACGSKCSKKVKACGNKPSNTGSNLPMSTMAKLRGLVNKSAIKAAK